VEHGVGVSNHFAGDGGALAGFLGFWSLLWRRGLLALLIIVVLSTQFLFQFDLYESYPPREILLGWLDYLSDELVVGGFIFVVVVATALVPANALRKRMLLAGAIVLGALAGENFMMLQSPLPPEVSAAAVLFAKTARWLVIAGLMYVFFVFQQQAAQAAAQIRQSELQHVQLDRQLTEAQLHAMQTQIEPHFLFNTLANVRRLYGTDPSRGRRMLGNFIAYLGATLPRMRGHETTLRQEVDLARAYLDVLGVRMGDRLSFRIDVPRSLDALPFPPIALSTLTENAVKHGINPLPEGGAIEITARLEDSLLKVAVADTGAGLRGSGGAGAGLANLRGRLAALYGDEARLAFESNAPRGIRATITVPVRAAAKERA
jgi:hypothetical protein